MEELRTKYSDTRNDLTAAVEGDKLTQQQMRSLQDQLALYQAQNEDQARQIANLNNVSGSGV